MLGLGRYFFEFPEKVGGARAIGVCRGLGDVEASRKEACNQFYFTGLLFTDTPTTMFDQQLVYCFKWLDVIFRVSKTKTRFSQQHSHGHCTSQKPSFYFLNCNYNCILSSGIDTIFGLGNTNVFVQISKYNNCMRPFLFKA